MDIAQQKAELRKEILAARRALSAEDLAKQSSQLAAQIFALLSWQQAKVVGLFASAPDEIQTDSIIGAALAAGKQVVLPRVCKQQAEPPSQPPPAGVRSCLIWHEIHSLADLEIGSFGISEPKSSLPVIDLADLEFLLVPAVAFDYAGNRLGYGGGFYDRELASFAGCTVSLALPCQLTESIPLEKWDLPVNTILELGS